MQVSVNENGIVDFRFENHDELNVVFKTLWNLGKHEDIDMTTPQSTDDIVLRNLLDATFVAGMTKSENTRFSFEATKHLSALHATGETIQ